MGKLLDLTNNIYGDWKVISFDNTKGKYKYYWNCECIHCGNKKSILGSSLKNEKSIKCDKCNKTYNIPSNIKGYSEDLTGYVYGDFTITKFVESKYSHSYWEGKCKCGRKEIHSITWYRSDKSIKKCKYCKKGYDEEVILKKQNKNDISFNSRLRKKYNTYEFKDEYVIINKNILIDKDDFKFINNLNRYVAINCSGYAYITKNNKEIFLHRKLMGLSDDFDKKNNLIVDHINGNRLDNRKCNLRIITKEINPINCKKYKNNTSGIKGVSWNKKLNKWVVQIQINKKKKYLGVYKDINEAIKVRKLAEDKYFGEYNRKESDG